MSISKAKPRTGTDKITEDSHDFVADDVHFDAEHMYVHLTNGETISAPLSRFPRLQHATPEQRNKWRLSSRGTALHWEEIDEDISIPLLKVDSDELLHYR